MCNIDRPYFWPLICIHSKQVWWNKQGWEAPVYRSLLCCREKVNSGPKDASCGDLIHLNVANAATQRKGGLTNSMSDLDGKRTSYFPPSITPLSLDKAKQYLTCHANYSEQEATDFLESLRQEKPPKKLRSRRAQNRIEKLPILRRG